ncbi:MAG: ATP-dependent RNA helicase HrpA, partial [Desulfobacterales bacterium]|nr:ATP-dependent RNA helicase HrpA [Desulfobacterales bacterium]
LLGILKTLLPERPEFRVVISSATLDTEKFARAYGGAPVVLVGGRLFSVEVEYMPMDPELEEAGELTYVDAALKAMDAIRANRAPGDVLIFMPTEQDILETCERLEGRRYPETSILPLFARLPASEQGRIYAVKGPKIVVATNVAETSLTIPGIRYVIDTGLARIAGYLPRTRTKSLPISPISQSSAEQRKGRSGRVRSGVCIRLYSEESFASRPAFTPPEILRSNLAEVILRMINLSLGDPASFPFLDRPTLRSIKDGYDLLAELGAIGKEGKENLLTEKGKVMARMPLDPRISRMMIEAAEEGCAEEVAVIASALSIQDPRERPSEKAALADQMHAPFKDPGSDFITLLNIWNRYHREWEALKTQSKMRKFCRAHFLSFSRMREWVYTHEQITAILKEEKIPFRTRDAKETAEPLYTKIHRSILSGFLSNIAEKKDKNMYQAARGREVMVFPGSTLFNKNAPWIVAAEMVKTSRLYARTAAKIDSAWLEVLGGDLCRSTYSEPHWVKERGEVRAFETVTLYGLAIVPRRSASYGLINPEEAHRIFIQSALVEGDVDEPLPFLTHNLELINRLSLMEDKLRRRDILVGEAVVADFYSSRLDGVHDLRTLKRLIKEKGTDEFLRLSEEDLLMSVPDQGELSRYPDEIAFGKAFFKTSYRFAPGKEDDGVTVQIPSGVASGIEAERLDWGIPGHLGEKVRALIKGLPKRYRRPLVPVPETVDLIMKEMEQDGRPLLTALAHFIYHRFGVDIPASVWNEVEIPEHLKMRLSLIDQRGREIRAARDPLILRQAQSLPSSETRSAVWKKA